jgi:hypothetical protein
VWEGFFLTVVLLLFVGKSMSHVIISKRVIPHVPCKSVNMSTTGKRTRIQGDEIAVETRWLRIQLVASR